MDEKARHDRGLTQRRKVLGDAHVERSIAARTDFSSEFQDIITRYAWGEIWTRPHYDERTRRILVIGTTMALDKWEEFRLHVRAALTEGDFSPADIKEIILQQMIYCGVPAANHAFREATVGALTARAGVSQPVVSKHLGVLKQAGLVRDRHQGRHTHYSAQLGALVPLIDWTSQMAGFWQSRFDDLEDLLKRMDQ